jgi:large conductance mechanosensitive channel
MWNEFRAFINRGNVLDLAVAVVMGAAFTAIVNSLVNDIIMPLVGVILGGIDFTSLNVTVNSAVIAYGNFIQAIINFLIIAWVVFLIVKAMNQMYKKPVPPPPAPTAQEKLLAEIRDLLAKQNEK